jgi:hypothetical protein
MGERAEMGKGEGRSICGRASALCRHGSGNLPGRLRSSSPTKSGEENVAVAAVSPPSVNSTSAPASLSTVAIRRQVRLRRAISRCAFAAPSPGAPSPRHLQARARLRCPGACSAPPPLPCQRTRGDWGGGGCEGLGRRWVRGIG